MTRQGSRAILILGPHRSGTSAVTRVLNLLGVDLGTDLMPPKPDRERAERRVEEFEADLSAVQDRLGVILSSRLFRLTGPLRRTWYRVRYGIQPADWGAPDRPVRS